MTKISLVAAVARNGVIGRAGALPWQMPEDMARFREVTMGHPVVMGRKTWDSLPERYRPLPGRRNVVVTRNKTWRADGAESAGSLETALEVLSGEPAVFVIGGAELFAAALPLAGELVLTEIDSEVDGDVFFPSWDRSAFDEVAREERLSTEGAPFAFVTYRRSDVAARQLAALADVDALFAAAELDYWLFGGWAVDFYAGRITRPHIDVDIAVWHEEEPRIAAALQRDRWRHAPEPDEDGGTGYERDGTRLELTYLVRSDGRVFTPLRDFEATWPDGAFGADVRELCGVRAQLVSLDALTSGKSSPRADPDDAAKDTADLETLSGL